MVTRTGGLPWRLGRSVRLRSMPRTHKWSVCYHTHTRTRTYMHTRTCTHIPLTLNLNLTGEYHGVWRGTKFFIAPEMAQNRGKGEMVLKYGDRIDIYALGRSIRTILPQGMNKRYVRTKQFLTIIDAMESPNPRQRPNAKAVCDQISKLKVPTRRARAFPSSKRAQAQINLAVGQSPKKRTIQPTREQPKKRLARATPAAQPTTPQLNQPQKAGETPQLNKPQTVARAKPRRPVKRQLATLISRPCEATAPKKKTPSKKQKKRTVSTSLQKKIDEAALYIYKAKQAGRIRGVYKEVCLRLRINLGPKDGWLGVEGADYKSIQVAVRTITNQEITKVLEHLEGKTKNEKVTLTLTPVHPYTRTPVHPHIDLEPR